MIQWISVYGAVYAEKKNFGSEQSVKILIAKIENTLFSCHVIWCMILYTVSRSVFLITLKIDSEESRII